MQQAEYLGVAAAYTRHDPASQAEEWQCPVLATSKSLAQQKRLDHPAVWTACVWSTIVGFARAFCLTGRGRDCMCIACTMSAQSQSRAHGHHGQHGRHEKQGKGQRAGVSLHTAQSITKKRGTTGSWPPPQHEHHGTGSRDRGQHKHKFTGTTGATNTTHATGNTTARAVRALRAPRASRTSRVSRANGHHGHHGHHDGRGPRTYLPHLITTLSMV